MFYFDNAATTFPKPESVYRAMDTFYREYGVNIGRGQFREASVANKLADDTRKQLLDLLHANSSYQCVFTSSATIAMNMILQGFPWKPGMNIYITPFEHNAILRTLHYLSKKIGFQVIQLTPDKDTWEYDYSNVKAQFQMKHPDMLVMTHASNSFGFINPIKHLFGLAKEYGAVTVCDMAQTAGLIDTDITNVNVDFAVFAGHKTLYAPFGIAGFVTNKGNLLKPFIYGGTGVDSANLDLPLEIPIKFEAGSHNIQAIAGLNAALKWMNDTGIDNIRKKELATTQELLSLLHSHYNINIIRCPDESNNIGVVSCTFDGYSSDSIGQVLSDHYLAVRTGLHCAPESHRFLGTTPDGTVRFSVSFFTDNKDLEALDEVLEYIEMS